MNDVQHTAYRDYLHDLAARMGLKDWAVLLERERPENPRHHASVLPVYGRKRCQVWISEAFFKDPPEEQRQTLVHELLHLHINPIRDALENGQEAMGEILYRALRGDMADHTEFAVDGIADVVAPFMPLPPEQEDSCEDPSSPSPSSP